MFVLSQVFVIISGIIFAISYLFRKKEIILILNVVNNIFFAIHFLVLKSFTASYSVFVIALFSIVIYFIEKYNKEQFQLLFLIISTILICIISIFTWEGPFSLMPTCASISTLIGTVLNKTLIVKFFYLASTILNTIYLFIIHSYFGFAINIGILVIGIVGIINQIRLNIKKV